jgi:hypothetical protein
MANARWRLSWFSISTSRKSLARHAPPCLLPSPRALASTCSSRAALMANAERPGTSALDALPWQVRLDNPVLPSPAGCHLAGVLPALLALCGGAEVLVGCHWRVHIGRCGGHPRHPCHRLRSARSAT